METAAGRAVEDCHVQMDTLRARKPSLRSFVQPLTAKWVG
jgi:hypothetical protein